MVNKCIICKVKEVKGQNGPYHRIPKDPVVRTTWLKALNLTGVKEWDRVCGSHFHPSDYWPQRKKTQPMKKLKPKAVPFLRVYAEERSEENGECYNDEMLAAGTVNIVVKEQAYDHVAAGSSSILNITTSDEEMEYEEPYEYIPKEAEEEELLQHRLQDLQAEKIRSLDASLSHLRKKMRKQEDRMKEVERRLDETEYLRDMLKLV